MKYSDIKDIRGLDAAREDIASRLESKGREIYANYDRVRDSYSPTSLFASAVKSISGKDASVFTGRIIESHVFKCREVSQHMWVYKDNTGSFAIKRYRIGNAYGVCIVYSGQAFETVDKFFCLLFGDAGRFIVIRG